MKDMFPFNPGHIHGIWKSEKYDVKFVHTESFRRSTVPYCLQLLNQPCHDGGGEEEDEEGGGSQDQVQGEGEAHKETEKAGSYFKGYY